MSVFGKKILTFIVFVLAVFHFNAKLYAQSNYMLETYDEKIFVISNYSGIDASFRETLNIPELLEYDIDGFRLFLDWDRTNNELVLINAQGEAIPFDHQLEIIRDYLEEKSDEIITLFLDFNVNVNELVDLINEQGLLPYIFQYNEKDGWPTLKTMVESGKRIVLFSMQEHRNSPTWLHYVWDYAVEPYNSLTDNRSKKGEFLKGDIDNNLLIYNDLNVIYKTAADDPTYSYLSENLYVIEHIKESWRNYGKTPNFILLDNIDYYSYPLFMQVRNFKTISGTLSYNAQVLENVNWEGLGSSTNGKYSFPIGPGESLKLIPKTQGFRFNPESFIIEEPEQDVSQNFIAIPYEVSEDLEAYYSFENGVKDFSINGYNGLEKGVEFVNDSTRGMVAGFDGESSVILPTADELKLRDHDFTVSAWVKIDKYKADKRDYCILGTTGMSYQQSIHLILRNGKPYFGFFSNDLEGNTIIEPGKWYNITWRYTKENGEQAIYVDGRLDSKSTGHPSYKGRNEIYIGLAGYDQVSNMIGYIDNLTIWSRAIGEQEIWNVSNDVAELTPKLNIFKRYPLLSKIAGVLLALVVLLWLYFKSPIRNYKKRFISVDKIKELEQVELDYPGSNYIKLFGNFKVIDKNSNDITNQFTPKIKQLFILILVSSQHNKKGISTKELTQILWPDLNFQNAKNSRGVTIRKLRLILKELDEVEVVFNIDSWTIQFSKNVYCDYVEAISLLKNTEERQAEFYYKFYQITRAGEAFSGESHEWLDDFKGDIGNSVIDTLMQFINKLEIERDHEFILKLADRILVTDPVNDQALSFKIKCLVQQNNTNTARFVYSKYASLYEEMYDEELPNSFEDFLNS